MQPNLYVLKSTLPKIKVLIAEDNEVNKLLVRRMLQHWGLEYKTASTGSEVVQLLKQEDFDVVLMDIQMPEKNGIEATEEIRNLADDTKKNVPIIALTANALKGEEKKYLQAGMNDYLTKPFKEKELFDVLERVVSKSNIFGSRFIATETTTPTSNNLAVNPENNLYDLTLVNELASGNEDFIKSLIQIFLDTIPATSKELLAEVQNENWVQAGKLAHKLKSTIDTMLIVSLKEDIRAIEMSGKTLTNLEQVPALAQKTDEIITQVTAQLKANFNL